MTGCPMNRNGNLWPDQPIHLNKFVTGRMARHMNRPVFISYQVNATPDQHILNLGNSRLISGNLTRGVNHGITGLQLYRFMRASCDFCHCCSCLSLRASTDNNHVISGNETSLRFRNKVWNVSQKSCIAGRANCPIQGSPHHADRPVVGSCSSHYRP